MLGVTTAQSDLGSPTSSYVAHLPGLSEGQLHARIARFEPASIPLSCVWVYIARSRRRRVMWLRKQGLRSSCATVWRFNESLAGN